MSNGIYKFKQLLVHTNLLHGVSSKKFGSMKHVENRSTDREALVAFAKSIGIIDKIVCMKQIHSGTVTVIKNTNILQIPKTDGLVTNKKHIPLAVLTADCLAILFYDPQKKVIGVAHAGYRGLLNHIIEHTILRFVSDFKSAPKDILVSIGPSIEADCYEVGKELIETFIKAFPTFKNIFIKKEGKYFLDLRSVTQQCLAKQGILKEHIESIDTCTKCDLNFYSYRGEDREARFVSIISLL